MNVLVINSGSSSIKFQMINMQTKKLMCKGLIERIGLEAGGFKYQKADNDKHYEELPIPDHKAGLKKMLETLTDETHGVIAGASEIDAVGHRIVHGGDKITESILLDDKAMAICESLIPLAPLHNPANLQGVQALKELLPQGTPHVGVFDTAFHASMPAESYIYAIPWKFYEKHGIRRFGFHGTSHQFVALRAAEILGKDIKDFNCITAHIGNGSSLTAIKGGVSVDTTLGFGTMCGVPMGTRAGDIDPAIVLHMIDELKLEAKEIHKILYKESGILGMSGISSDMRDVEAAAEEGHEHARIALDVLCHWLSKYICGLASNFERLDAIIFTAGIGECSPYVRDKVCPKLKVLGAHYNPAVNNFKAEERIISTDDSPVKIMVVPTNEELMIALDTKHLAGK
ncbi:MAG: acetate kinase [Candidatus Cloacimonetes bacterium]|nr:acetate kinase [Candidatus Cloacimonadota bacterium]